MSGLYFFPNFSENLMDNMPDKQMGMFNKQLDENMNVNGLIIDY